MQKLPSLVEIAKNIVERLEKNELGTGGANGEAILKSLGDFRVEYHIAGDFTTAILISKDGSKVFSGVSKRSRADRPNGFTGRCFALTRALDSYIVISVGLQTPTNHFVIKE